MNGKGAETRQAPCTGNLRQRGSNLIM